jgi:nitrate reductase NapAB chaperone NapD
MRGEDVSICSYLVIPEPGAGPALRQRLEAVPGCDVVPAENRDVLILVTDTADRQAEDLVRHQIEGLPGIQALLQTFKEVEVP